MLIRIDRVVLGTNDDGVEIKGPATQPPSNYLACEITETEYIYTVADETE